MTHSARTTAPWRGRVIGTIEADDERQNSPSPDRAAREVGEPVLSQDSVLPCDDKDLLAGSQESRPGEDPERFGGPDFLLELEREDTFQEAI